MSDIQSLKCKQEREIREKKEEIYEMQSQVEEIRNKLMKTESSNKQVKNPNYQNHIKAIGGSDIFFYKN